MQDYKKKDLSMKICVVYKQNSPFVIKDIELLSKYYDVTPIQFELKLRKMFKLIRLLRGSDVVFIWFASYHAFFTTLLTRKPKIIVAGGYDVAGEPEIHYGLMIHPLWKRMVKFSLKRAKKIISVSESNKNELIRHLGITSSVIVYNTVNWKNFGPSGNKDDTLVITVGYVDKVSWVRKGFSTFVDVAKKSSELKNGLQFVVGGKVSEDMKEEMAKIQQAYTNLKFTGFLSEEELLHLYQEAKVYCQLSYHEGYGISVAEAMLCECVPVVTDKGALPEVVGDTGFYTEYGNISQTIDAIQKAIQSQDEGKRARKRILEQFPQEDREKKLKEIIEEIHME
jgi:glycosyltransferase involved in cell wall biosynthesis